MKNAKAFLIPLLLTSLVSILSCTGDSTGTGVELSSANDGTSSTGQLSSGALDGSSSSVTSIDLGAAPTASVLQWNGAKGAYSIIMDDFCMATTQSLSWADSIAHARGLSIGFAVVAGSCGEDDWSIARTMVSHGSEPVNHSYSHTQSDTWLTADDMTLETATSTDLIATNTGFHPTFFGYPFDFATTESQNALEALNYLGARSYNKRTYSHGDFNAFDLATAMTVEYDARQPAAPDPNAQYQLFGMDEYADQAVSNGAWALRETHGVADGSWGAWTQVEFVAHMDHLASLVNSGDLWVAPPSTVLRYMFLTPKLTWNIVTQAAAFEVQWTTDPDSLSRYATPVKIQLSGSWNAKQNGSDLGAALNANGTLVAVDPSKGSMFLTPR